MKPINLAIVAFLIIVSGMSGYLFGKSSGDADRAKLTSLIEIMDKDEMMKMIRDGSFRRMTSEYAKGVKNAEAEDLLMKNGVSEKSMMLYRDMPMMMEKQMKQFDDVLMMK